MKIPVRLQLRLFLRASRHFYQFIRQAGKGTYQPGDRLVFKSEVIINFSQNGAIEA